MEVKEIVPDRKYSNQEHVERQPYTLPDNLEEPVIRQTKTKIAQFDNEIDKERRESLPKSIEGLQRAFNVYKSINIKETPQDKEMFTYFILDYFVYENGFSVIENNGRYNVISYDPSNYTEIVNPEINRVLHNNGITTNDVKTFLKSKSTINNGTANRSISTSSIPQFGTNTEKPSTNQKTPLNLNSDTMADAVRNPIGFINNTLGSMNPLSSLSLVVLSIWAIFGKPFEGKFGKFLLIVGGYGALQAFGFTEEIARSIEGKNTNTNKVISWSWEKLKNSFNGATNFTKGVIEKIGSWYHYSNFEFGFGPNKKSLVDGNFLDLFNISQSPNGFTGDKLVGADGKEPTEQEKDGLKTKLADLYNRGISAFNNNKQIFTDTIKGKSVVEVEKLVDDKVEENKKNSTQTAPTHTPSQSQTTTQTTTETTVIAPAPVVTPSPEVTQTTVTTTIPVAVTVTAPAKTEAQKVIDNAKSLLD